MPTFVVEPTSIDVEGVVDLLDLAVGGTDAERLDRVRARYLAEPTELAAVFLEGSVVGVVGYLGHPGGRDMPRRVELLHIATARCRQRTGIGTAMIRWVHARYPGDPIEAQTDCDGVGFYRSVGFEIESLGELYPGVERFRVVLEPSTESDTART
ncbi:GNAT family N-acetyltransferase [Rhodococcus pyridinivorans]|jgi:ribosomal protein S18 acetylase RimI-like enzyme|uniref:GNAT family N-acetyltransferase n=1 Tax=Rhodococcus pyridinivorans TaxID=103816 RepID=UPI00110D87EF|nr:GNAT family N-acetyltransferase [Rhodococcus pyridinivorans]